MSDISPTQAWTAQQKSAHMAETCRLMDMVRAGGVHELDNLQTHATQLIETGLPLWPLASAAHWLLNEGWHHQTPKRLAICTTHLEAVAERSLLPSEMRKMSGYWCALLATTSLGPRTRDRAIVGVVRLANNFLLDCAKWPEHYRERDVGSDLLTLGTALTRHTPAASPGHLHGVALMSYANLLPNERALQPAPIADIDGMIAALRAQRASAAPAPK